MRFTGWITVAASLILGGWLTFDGLHAFTCSDYVTQRDGPHAGELGPWSKLVVAVGLDPRSDLIKGVHVGLGALWLLCALGHALTFPPARWGLMGCAVLSLWYVPFGAIVGILVLILTVTLG
jgi:hypothetical protein